MMLDEAESAAFKQSVSQVKQLASSVIESNTTAHQTIHFISTLHQGVDQVAQKTASLNPAIACKAGCSHCCENRTVEVTVPEAFYIAEQLKSLPKADLDFVILQLAQHVKNKETGTPRACTFLSDHQCTIYAIRPSVCRKAHSISVDACASESAEIPQHLEVIVGIDALMAGTTEAYEENNLPSEAMELNAAILAALTDTDWFEKWYQEKRMSEPK